MTPAPRETWRTAPAAARRTRSSFSDWALASARRGGPATPFAAIPFPSEWHTSKMSNWPSCGPSTFPKSRAAARSWLKSVAKSTAFAIACTP
jgi:hypothetical protein